MAFRKKISFLGIFVGSVLDILLSNIWVLFLSIFVIIRFNIFNPAIYTPTEMTEQVFMIMRSNPVIFSINFLAGVFCTMLGGFISAWIAQHDELLNGALSAILCVLSTLCGLFSGAHALQTILLSLGSLILSPLFAMLGGYLRLLWKRKRAEKLQSAPTVNE